MVYYIVSGLLLMFFWCPCMAINVNVQYNGGFLPDIILWTQCYLHRGTCLNAMKRFCICGLLIPPKRFDIFPPITGGCSEGLGVVLFFFKPLPGIGLHDPLHGRQACPESNSFHERVGRINSREGANFVLSPPKTGTNL